MIYPLITIAIVEAIALFIFALRIQEIESEAAKAALKANHDAAIASAARAVVRFPSKSNLEMLARTIGVFAVVIFSLSTGRTSVRASLISSASASATLAPVPNSSRASEQHLNGCVRPSGIARVTPQPPSGNAPAGARFNFIDGTGVGNGKPAQDRCHKARVREVRKEVATGADAPELLRALDEIQARFGSGEKAANASPRIFARRSVHSGAGIQGGQREV